MIPASPREVHVAVDPSLDPRMQALARLVGVVDRLRAPDGCPWDKKQTLPSMAPYIVEEAFEALEAVETQSDAAVGEELGDVLMVVALMCRIAQDAGRFDLATAANAVADKLIRRHPHVFGEVKAETAEEVLTNWEAIKKSERADKAEDTSALAGVPNTLPALQRAQRVCGKAISAGFQWDDARGAFAKLVEEQSEFADVWAASKGGTDPSATVRERLAHELGDVLLAAAHLAHYLDFDPERLAREAGRRFETRFRSMESALGRPMKSTSLPELLEAWQQAKAEE